MKHPSAKNMDNANISISGRNFVCVFARLKEKIRNNSVSVPIKKFSIDICPLNGNIEGKTLVMGNNGFMDPHKANPRDEMRPEAATIWPVRKYCGIKISEPTNAKKKNFFAESPVRCLFKWER